MTLCVFHFVRAKITSEDRKHTLGGVFVPLDSNMGPVIDKEGGVTSISGNEVIIAHVG